MELEFMHKSGQHPYIVAEVNSSHNGDMATAKKMIEEAANCGCDCVKFQSWSSESLYSQTYYLENPIAKRFVKKFSLAEEQLAQLASYCKDLGVAFASTPYSHKEVDFLVDVCKVSYLKIASMDLNNYPFLDYIARTGLPIVLSTGMGELQEIDRAVETIEQAGNSEICLLHCTSIYPSEPEIINLRNITGLQKRYPHYCIGFSDHSLGTEIAAAAVAFGACLIEKHLTLDKTKIGMDNQMAVEPDEMKLLVSQCHRVYEAMGEEERKVSRLELEQREKMRRSVVYARDIPAGKVLCKGDLDVKRPGTGVAPEHLEDYVGCVLRRDVAKDTLLRNDDVSCR